MDEKSIISHCLMGDGEAFGMIVNRYQSQLLHFAWSLLGDQEEAKDAAQDAFVRAYFHLKKYDPNRSFKTWLFTIAYNRCMDKIRQRQSQTRFVEKMGKEQQRMRHADNPEKRLEDYESYELLLDKLNKKEKIALVLKWNAGYLSREIASIMGCKESTVRVYILNAKRKLKKFLEKE
jgi:RNA polymerase sigma-70 factor (ECF subfamily)